MIETFVMEEIKVGKYWNKNELYQNSSANKISQDIMHIRSK